MAWGWGWPSKRLASIWARRTEVGELTQDDSRPGLGEWRHRWVEGYGAWMCPCKPGSPFVFVSPGRRCRCGRVAPDTSKEEPVDETAELRADLLEAARLLECLPKGWSTQLAREARECREKLDAHRKRLQRKREGAG